MQLVIMKMFKLVSLLVVSLLVQEQTQKVSGSKILLNIPLTTFSEQNLYTPLANALATRGHQVTVISRKKTIYESKNVIEIVPLNFTEYLDVFSDGWEMRRVGWKLIFTMDYSWNEEACRRVYESPSFLKTVSNQKFDLIITNSIFHACLYAVMPKYQSEAPFILVSTMPLSGYTHDLTGFSVPTSFVPNALFSVSDRMNLIDRAFNTILDNYFTITSHLFVMPAMDKIAQSYLGPDIPSAFQIERNVSLIFSNTHISITPPRPLMPDIVEIGGLHCRPGKPLPKDLQQFLSKSRSEGFIYFSLGSVVKGHQMPLEFKLMFLKVFSQLKQQVLWKYEADDLTSNQIPPNVRLEKWLPQQDILSHKNIRVFITHAGMFSTQEATYHGVPIIGFPVNVDQNLNIRKAVENGYAIELEILDLTEDILRNAIKDILTNKKYLENAKRMSALFRDQIQTPTERAIYWIEYVIRHRGEGHLRSAARDLNFIQYHSLDVISTIFIIISVLSMSLFLLLRKCLRSFTNFAVKRKVE